MSPKQKSLYSEKDADRLVINNLLREISRLKGVKSMSKIIKSDDGKVYLCHDYEELDATEANDLLGRLQNDIAVLQTITSDEQADQAEDSAEDAPTTPEEPVTPETPADPNPITPPDPGTPPAPVTPPVEPGAPADTVPAADPAAATPPAPVAGETITLQ